MKNWKLIMIVLLVLFGIIEKGFSQPTTNHCITGNCNPNTFLNTDDPNTIEYDNIVSTYHSSIARQDNGKVVGWGERMASSGTSHVLAPTEINAANYPGLTGNILKFAGGSTYTTTQFAVLTTTGLFVWGSRGAMVPAGITSGTAFQKVEIGTYDVNNGALKADGLPDGVAPEDVKMLFGGYQTLAITTCSGEAWVLTTNGLRYGDNAPDNDTNDLLWHRVHTAANTPLSNVVAMRGGTNVLLALTASGEVYTWGRNTILGNGTAQANRIYATKMTLPEKDGSPIVPKMIGTTIVDNNFHTAYILSTDGDVYSLGRGTQRQLGNFTNTSSVLSWVQVQKTATAGDYLTNVAYISPQEHNATNAAISALTTDGRLWAWGRNDYNMLGTSTTFLDPTEMPGSIDQGLPYDAGKLNWTDKVIAVETSGHTTIIIKECSAKFGYVGHKVNGSMGDGTSTGGEINEYNFSETDILQLCGAPSSPAVRDIDICEGELADLTAAEPSYLPVGMTGIEWWTTIDRQPGTQVTNTEAVVAGTYYAFYLPEQEIICPTEITVTENPPPVVPQNVENIKVFVNNDFEFTVTVSGGVTYIWEYATVEVPADTDWNVLDNDTYNGMIILDETTFRISYATKAIDGLWVRLKAVSDMGCEAYSNEVFIEVADGMIITNPMLRNRARQ